MEPKSIEDVLQRLFVQWRAARTGKLAESPRAIAENLRCTADVAEAFGVDAHVALEADRQRMTHTAAGGGR